MSLTIDDFILSVNKFRKKPDSLIKKFDLVKKGMSRLHKNDPFIKTITDFIPVLQKQEPLPQLELSEALNQIAETELQKFLDDDKYNKFRTGNALKGIIPNGNLADYCLIAEEWSTDEENITTKLLLNKEDKKNVGQLFLLDPDTKRIGFAQQIVDEDLFIVTIITREEEKKNLRSKKKKGDEDEDDELPEGDLTELKMAFDLFDPDHTGNVKANEIIYAMQSMKFDKTNPILYKIISEINNNGEELISWNKFANRVEKGINDRESEKGLEQMYGLFIDDPSNNVMNFDVFKRICKEVGENLEDDEIKHIIETTCHNGVDIGEDDFQRYMMKK